MSYEPRWNPTLTSDERCAILADYARHYKCRHFVETGSADGDTCRIMRESFDFLYTIEIVPSVARATARRLKKYQNIQCFEGDSTEILPGLLARINAPCFFWLDGHYCGSLEKRGPKDTPIQEELEIIFATKLPHVIFVDDARLFGRDPAYPTVEWVRDIATSQDIEFTFSYADDMMRVEPK